MLTGMDAARFNFSHGTHESHLATLTKVKRVRDELGAAVATILAVSYTHLDVYKRQAQYVLFQVVLSSIGVNNVSGCVHGHGVYS